MADHDGGETAGARGTMPTPSVPVFYGADVRCNCSVSCRELPEQCHECVWMEYDRDMGASYPACTLGIGSLPCARFESRFESYVDSWERRTVANAPKEETPEDVMGLMERETFLNRGRWAAYVVRLGAAQRREARQEEVRA